MLYRKPRKSSGFANGTRHKPSKGSRTKYRSFATAAEALRYAVEDLRTPKAFGAWLEVGDERFNSSEIQRLYEADEYPLRKSE